MARTRIDRLALTAVRTDGAILPPSLLKRIHSEDPGLSGLKPTDYGLSGERVREAASRAWNALQAPWRAFQAERARLAPAAEGTGMTRSRWLYQILKALDYGALDPIKGGLTVGDREFPISHLYGHAPLHLIGCGQDLDTKTAISNTKHQIPDTKRMSPHGLVQLFLNASDASLWGMVSNGLRWRILRDSVSLSRQALVEFDLEMIFEGQLYDEFLLFYLLCHQSRLKSEKPEGCWLETWSQTAGEEGKRALDTLRSGVERAIEVLGQGALRQTANAGLRDRVRTGELDRQDYYRQLLRLVYRLLFLFVAEDRGLLLHPQAPDDARSLYQDYYSSQRLRLLAERLRGSARHNDLYTVLKLVCRKLGEPEGCPELGLPALGGFLFSATSTPDLDAAEIANADLLDAIRCLAVTQEGGRRARVDYRNLGSVELGSVYESLLELHPDLASDGSRFTLRSVTGSERKSTGSYYTPDSLIQCLLDTALDPVIDAAVRGGNGEWGVGSGGNSSTPHSPLPTPEERLLALKVCDPAAGSGHFLIAATHRLARRLAQVRTDDEEPGPDATRRALRDVIGRCIYGVDINPMAVELCKVALWMEALEPGRPLSFLDHHIQCGNSLLGTTPALLQGGIPEAAFTAIEGDDKEFCTEVRRRHRDEASDRFQEAFDEKTWYPVATYAAAMQEIETVDDTSLAGVQQREARFAATVESENARNVRLWANAWCAAFVWRKRNDGSASYPLTEKTFLAMARDPAGADPTVVTEIERLAVQYRFFHWHLAFPDVFHTDVAPTEKNPLTGWSGGFDAVLGNPPWDRININQKEWFAARSNEIATAINVSGRSVHIADLKSNNPGLWTEWVTATRTVMALTHFARASSRYPLCAHGDINLYSLFAELNLSIAATNGCVGCILPSGIATDNSTRHYFNLLVEEHKLLSFYEFENEGFFSAGQGHMLRFALVTISGASHQTVEPDFFFQGQSLQELADRERHFTLSGKDIELINPNTRTCPIFRTWRDAELTKSIYRRLPILQRDDMPEADNPWLIGLGRTLHMGDDASLFCTKEQLLEKNATLNGNWFTLGASRMLPLYEAKMIYQFDHRYGNFADTETTEREHRLPKVPIAQLMDPNFLPLPYYWVPEHEVEVRLKRRGWDRHWLMGWRDVTDSRASLRTVIATVFPRTGTSDKLPLILPKQRPSELLSVLMSFVLDYCSRQKLGGISLKQFIFKQLPIPHPNAFASGTSWTADKPLATWITSRVLELVYTASDIRPYAEDCGYYGPPFVWNEERRFLLRCELDAAYFHLYEIGRDDVDYIMETFPVVRRKDEAEHGEYRTKRVILEIYDTMQHAIASGLPYQTRLDPPPANGWTPPEHLLREAFTTPPSPEPEELILVSPPTAAPELDIGLGEVSNDLSARVRINGKLGVLVTEAQTEDGKNMIVVQFDGESKRRAFTVPPVTMERLGPRP